MAWWQNKNKPPAQAGYNKITFFNFPDSYEMLVAFPPEPFDTDMVNSIYVTYR